LRVKREKQIRRGVLQTEKISSKLKEETDAQLFEIRSDVSPIFETEW